jgi:hypothetical protein
MESPFHSFTALTESGRTVSERARGGKVFKDVTLIKAGLGNRRDKNYYTPQALQDGVKSGLFEGLRAFADHPDAISEETHPERSVRDIVGIYTNARYREDSGGPRVVGDLRVLRSAKWLADMVDELVEMGQAGKVGISINGRGQTVPRTIKAAEADGSDMEVHDVQKFVDLRSADIVTEAGAGGGFQQLLECARCAQEKRPMTISEMQAIHEAAGKGDQEAIKKLLAMVGEGLTECKADEAAEADDETDDESGDQEADVDDADDEDEGDETVEAKKKGGKGRVFGKSEQKATTGSFVKKAKSAHEAKDVTPGTLNEALQRIAALEGRLRKTDDRNNRLAEALKVRQSTDRARKLLKESRIPSDLQPDLLRRMVGKSEEDMKSEVRFTQRLLEARDRNLDDEFDEIEGNPSRIREGRGGDGRDETDTVLEETGLPLRKK